MRAEDGDSLRRLHGFRGAHREPQPVDVVEQPRDRRARRAGHELVGHVEQRGDGVEVLGGPQSGLAAPLPRAEQPARQTAALPHLPQRRARIGRTTRGALQHGAHAAQRPRVWRGKPVGQPVAQRRHEQVAELAGRHGRIEPAQRPAQLTQRHRVDPPDGPGEQFQRVRRGQAVRGGGQRRQQRPHHRVVGQRRVHRRRCHRHTRRQSAPAVGPRPPGAPNVRSPPSVTTARRRRGGPAAACRPPPRLRRAPTPPGPPQRSRPGRLGR